MADPERLLARYSALTGVTIAEEIESLDLVSRLATVFYQLGKAYVLSAIDPRFRELVFQKAVEVEAVRTRGRGFVDGVLARGREDAGGVDWRQARHLLNGRLSEISTPLEKGRRLLDEALTADPSHEEARLYRAYLAAREGKTARASDEFRRVFRTAMSEVNRGHAAVQLGNLYGAENEYKKALACYRWVRMSGLLDVEQRFFVVRFNMAVCYAALRRPDRSVGAFRELLDRHSDRIGDVIELFAGANAELRAAIDSQPELALGLLQECPELFQPSDAHEAGASESEETPS
jgi:tetratricopeptide (TPR) repeat protein